jgi:hypothetical protein
MNFSPIQAREEYAQSSALQERYSSVEEYMQAKATEQKQKVSADIQARLSRATARLEDARANFYASNTGVESAKEQIKLDTEKYGEQAETSIYAQNTIANSEKRLSGANMNNDVALSILQQATSSYGNAQRTSMLDIIF